MKQLATLALVLSVASMGWAREPFLVEGGETLALNSPQPTPVAVLPTPDAQILPGQPIPAGATFEPGVIVCDATQGAGLTLYPTKVRQARNIAPCAVEKIVSVPDPCNPCCCVLISICVPPCACEEVTCSRDGQRVRFDYGDYAVNVIARRGKLIVNYDD